MRLGFRLLLHLCSYSCDDNNDDNKTRNFQNCRRNEDCRLSISFTLINTGFDTFELALKNNFTILVLVLY